MSKIDKVAPLALLLAVLLLVIDIPLQHFAMLPGDTRDTQLVNYLLEQVYQYLAGRLPSIWHPGFYAPFPFVLGLSDNMFGAFPVYGLARLAGMAHDSAFQLWFVIGHVSNYLAAYWVLRRLERGCLASAVGALVFAFALPVSGQIVHPQLLYRFAVPLALYGLIQFLRLGDWRYLLQAIAWTVWQYFCSIYIGFFTSLLMGLMVMIWLAGLLRAPGTLGREAWGRLLTQWQANSLRAQWGLVLGGLALLVALAWMFYPYAQVARLYGARPASEILAMLPQPQSYFMARISLIWGPLVDRFPPMFRINEQQMFVGALPLLLCAIGLFFAPPPRQRLAFDLLMGSMLLAVLLTLSVDGHSAWQALVGLPLVSAMRAMARLILVLLFPLAYGCALAVDGWLQRGQKFRILVGLALGLMLFEMAAIRPPVSPKSEMRAQLLRMQDRLPKDLAPDAILFFAQRHEAFFENDLNAMWVALQHGHATLNGYSGFVPSGYTETYVDDCSELPKRVLAYLKFSGQSGNATAYRELMGKIVPIGFFDCPAQWFSEMPTVSSSTGPQDPAQIAKVTWTLQGMRLSHGLRKVAIRVHNGSDRLLTVMTPGQKPLHLAWRFVDAQGRSPQRHPVKRLLPFDMPPHSDQTVDLWIPPKAEIERGRLEVYLGQAAVKDLPPLVIPWPHSPASAVAPEPADNIDTLANGALANPKTAPAPRKTPTSPRFP